MIVDCILDRREGSMYSARNFYHYCNGYSETGDRIARAMDFGAEEDVKTELCRYIIEGEYNPAICAYIWAKNWLDDEPAHESEMDFLFADRQ